MNEQSIRDRIAGRQEAVDVADLLVWTTRSDSFRDAFIETLDPERQAIERQAPGDEKPEPLTRLEATVLPFGKHLGQRFADVPLAYLQWLCSSQEEFYKSLRAYLRHPDVWRKQDEEE